MTDLIEQAETYFQQGLAHARSGDFEAATDAFRKSAEADPAHGFTHNNLGSALAALGRHEEAVQSFRRALQIDPHYAQAHFNLGESLHLSGRQEEAIPCFIRTLDLDPRHGEAFTYLGRAHQAAGRLNEALACLRQSVAFAPDNPDGHGALGTVLMLLRRPDEAVRAFENALAIDSHASVARAYLMDLLARDCDWDKLEVHKGWIERLGVEGGRVPPFTMLALEDHPERHRIRSERFAESSYASIVPLPLPARPAARPERLRIGYFSADFHEHATMYLCARMFELHDRDRFSITAYSYGREESGPMRERALKAVDRFRDVRGFSDKAVAAMAREDGIDIAVDMKGYTQHQRVGIFAYRPAPVQVSFLGYPGTLGAAFIDYMVADRTIVPDEQRAAYSEHILYLPHSYQPNDQSRAIADHQWTRAEAGLPEHGFVFCCFNSSYKVTPVEFAIWMDLLKKVDGSVLLLLANTPRVEANLRGAATRAGVDPDRLVFAAHVAPAMHLARHRLADLFLDTFNYNAHTTTSDALWAGLPLVTRPGKGFAARVAASLLHALDLPELVAASDADYAALALELATKPARLEAVRAKLQANRSTQPLFDSGRFTRDIEQGFDLAYQRYLDRQAPADIVVPR